MVLLWSPFDQMARLLLIKKQETTVNSDGFALRQALTMGLLESIPVAASLIPIDEMASLLLIKKQETTVNTDNRVHIKAGTYNGLVRIYPCCSITNTH